MKKGIIIDLHVSQSRKDTKTIPSETSKELETAIKNLIHQLRELGPISHN